MDAYSEFIKFVAINLNPSVNLIKLNEDINELIVMEKKLRVFKQIDSYFYINIKVHDCKNFSLFLFYLRKKK